MKIMRRFLIVWSLVLVSLLAPLKSFGQTDQVIVMVCASEFNPAKRLTLTLDLAQKTVGEEYVLPNAPGYSPIRAVMPQGHVTRITDQNITWGNRQSSDTPSWTGTLNRYTGHLAMSSTGGTEDWNCQKQQKQL